MRSRTRLSVPLIVVGLVLAGLAPAASAAKSVPSDKSYAAVLSPDVVSPSGSTSLQLRNLSSSQSFASAEVRLKAGSGVTPSVSVSLNPGWGVASQSPVTVAGQSVWQLVSSGTGTTNAVQPGGTLTVTLSAAADAPVQSFTVGTAVKQSNDFSGTGNDFANSGPDPVLYVGAGPAVALQFAAQPNNIQAAGQAPGTDTTPVLMTCPVVQALDARGNVATSFAGRVLLTPSDAGLGLTLGGSTPAAASAVAGIARFGTGTDADHTCTGGLAATKLGFGYTLTASSAGVVSKVSEPFDVLQFYALCGASCSTPTLTAKSTTASVSATGSAAAALTFDVGQRGWEEYASACNPDVGATGLNPDRAPVTVDLDAHAKTVTLVWSKQAVQWAINNGASQWRVCMAATYPFASDHLDTFGAGTDADPTIYVGGLLRCDSPSVGALDPCVQKLNKTHGMQQATIYMPARDGDPRMI